MILSLGFIGLGVQGLALSFEECVEFRPQGLWLIGFRSRFFEG